MIPEVLRINGATRQDRHEMIAQVKKCLAESQGFLLDFNMFSNMSISLNIEIKRDDIPALFEKLSDISLNLSGDTEKIISKHAVAVSKKGDDIVTGTIQITFVHNDPDLRIEVPAVPG